MWVQTSGFHVSATRRLLASATARLAAAGIETPRVDAELLLSHVLGVSRARLTTIDDVAEDAAATFAAALARRVERVPLQHITGATPFRHIELAVGPGVFVPRPETELLVDALLHLPDTSVVVDLCSGSGAIALAIADEVVGARVLAVERDPAALHWLRRNAVGSAVEVVVGDVRDEALLAELRGCVDAVVCNPPYVPAASTVAPEVRHDPDTAVFAGTDGLALIPHVIARAAELLKAGGTFAVEHDDTHEHAVPALLAEDGRWSEIVEHHDLAGRPRYVTATRTT